MARKTCCLPLIFILAGQVAQADDYRVENHIIFNNKTSRYVVSTALPYVDNFSYLFAAYNTSGYKFLKPTDAISPKSVTQTDLSYDWHYHWYGVSQFSYNYEGRSKEYGCFITEIRLSWRWGDDYHIVLSSYRKDPSYPNDYLVCHAAKQTDGNNIFLVDFSSSQDATEKRDSERDDTERYDIAGDGYELAKTSYFYLNKPIPLNPAISLYPDQLKPEKIRNTPPQIHNSDEYYVMTVVNHASASVVAGPRFFDVFSQFSDKYYFEQPAIILSGAEAKITIGLPDFSILSFGGWGGTNFSLQQFSYQMPGYAKDSGCFITFSNHTWNTPVAAFYFDPLHSNNLYCLITHKNKIEIYDDPNLVQLSAAGCLNDDLKTCVSISNFDRSSLHRFYKNGDSVLTGNYYSKVPLSPDPEMKHYLGVNSPPSLPNVAIG